MYDALPAGERDRARRVILAPAQTFEPGAPLTAMDAGTRNPFAMLIVTGAVLRETCLGERPVAELLGAPDLVETHPEIEPCTLPSSTRYVVHQPTTVAILDDRFRLAARRWPALFLVLAEQHARQARRASRHLAALALPRVEDRVLALFCDLADRWGRMTPQGIRVDLPLTHAVIGQLVAARRPTVSLALTGLAATGKVVRQDGGSWLLTRDLALAA
jgi:CRP-like cAMP-binding protein